ncbi:Cupin domain-containing protein [uncultured Mycobacterium sp.]|uniref:Cupin n=2 Tax=Mycobacteriaceae TaxID=1762 RepID=A0A064CF22_9MYCO|nr:cupin domain-containing protein [Mycolicibacterium aromaticivorans]KDE97308.1 cupin [Mycolicibacterium aromaticivorans JS19b1 = JCM 16368]SBS79316.1 Cupin domain-containing protein [uncultured Mycobacterium sp.]
MGLSNAELDDFARSMARAEGRDSQEVTEENLVVSSTEAHWVQTGSPSQIGLLLRIPARAFEFFLQKIPAGEASDLHRHVHESVHFVLHGSGRSEIGDQGVQWNTGDFVYTPPWVWHRHYADDGLDVEMIVIENSRLLAALDATQRETLGNITFAQAFGSRGTRSADR